jgi:hypothetical protein
LGRRALPCCVGKGWVEGPCRAVWVDVGSKGPAVLCGQGLGRRALPCCVGKGWVEGPCRAVWVDVGSKGPAVLCG